MEVVVITSMIVILETKLVGMMGSKLMFIVNWNRWSVQEISVNSIFV